MEQYVMKSNFHCQVVPAGISRVIASNINTVKTTLDPFYIYLAF